MKKGYKIEIRNLVLIIIISLTIIFLLLSLIINDERKLSKAESVLKDGLILMQKTIYFPFRYLENKYQEHSNLKHKYISCLKKNKERLEYDLLLAERDELKRNLKELEALLSLNEVASDYDLILATVINRDISGWFNTLTIDKGRKSDLKEGMMVIANQGLIGKIIKTTYLTSEIKLITANDSTNQISVAIITDEEEVVHGLLKGYDQNNRLLIIKDVIDGSVITPGNQVITSGFSTLYPKGILIGTVFKISSDEFGISKIIYVKAEANFTNLRFVSIFRVKETSNDN